VDEVEQRGQRGDVPARQARAGRDALRDCTAAAPDPEALAEAVVGWLEQQGLELPSVYLLRSDRLRCVAVRGYWQVLDGFAPERGVLAETFRTGSAQLIPDVRLHPDYIAAVPGVLAELCLPLRHGDRVVGGLNVELLRPLDDETVGLARQAAEAFERRLAELGGPAEESPWERLARRSAELASLTDPDAIAERAVHAACDLTGLETAVIVAELDGQHQVLAAEGPLADGLRRLPQAALAEVAAWTAAATSVYTIGRIAGSGFPGHQELRARGVAALVSATLPSRGRRHGFLLAASPEPTDVDRIVAQHLEVLAAHAASTLHTAFALATLRERAAQDPLTGLGHGATFHDDLAALVETPAQSVAVLLVDLDDFKQVNDTLGHATGDRVLVEAARAMQSVLRPADRLYRIGGDEFAALLTVASLADAERIGGRVAAAVRSAGDVTASVGCALLDPDGDRSEDVLGRADLALYETKRRGRDGVTSFRPELRDAVLDRARMAADLAAAIPRGELSLVYQPVVDLGGLGALGVEALVRWHHPRRGTVGPNEFIPVAEEDGLISDIGRWVLDEACRQLAAWDAQGWGRSDFKLGVNVSVHELGAGFGETVRSALDRHGIAADRLVIEVTESVFIDDQRAVEPLRQLRSLGVHVAVDDFGTGYSSLAYLRRLPVDILKVDRSFLSDLDSAANRAVVQAILQLGRTLGLSTVAEGIEHAEQAEVLRALGCQHAQGFLWSRPVPPDGLRDVCGRLAGVG
jgi:diguanylate cyclase (GGDEF)-like protein